MRELESTVRRPLLGNLTANVTVRFWPNLAAKPTLRTALRGFTVDPKRPSSNTTRRVAMIWSEQGCEVCREGVLPEEWSPEAVAHTGGTNLRPGRVASNLQAHAYLHH